MTNTKTLPTIPSFQTYGGAKRDYVNLVNPSSDRTADQINSAFYDLACIARIAPKFVVHFDGSGNVINYDGCILTKIPYVEPVVVKVASGNYTVELPEMIPNAFGDEVEFNYQFASAGANGGSLPCIVQTTKPGEPNKVIVKCYSTGGVLVDPEDSITVFVF